MSPLDILLAEIDQLNLDPQTKMALIKSLRNYTTAMYENFESKIDSIKQSLPKQNGGV